MHDGCGAQRPEALHHRGFAPAEFAQQWRIERVGDAADEIDQLASADIEAEDRPEVAVEDHPYRADARQQQRQDHRAARALADEEPRRHRRHQRHQRIDRTGRDRQRHGERDEHGDEVDRHQRAHDAEAPGCRRSAEAVACDTECHRTHQCGGEKEANRVERDGVDVRNGERTGRERAGDQCREHQHAQMRQ